ncbi:MAG: ATPase, partial [Gammaproteobacteria bacterium]
GGIGSGGDSGTSSRVLGTFLTWLQECEAPVFTMVTANNITSLPPELLRRGRFDAIFASGLPTDEEKLEILKIHMRRRGWEPKEFASKEMNKVVGAAKGFVGAEIEAAVKDGLILAFNAGEQFEPDHCVQALKVMVPLSKAYAEQIQVMTLWAKQNATPASKRYEDMPEKVVALKGRKPRVRKDDETEH